MSGPQGQSIHDLATQVIRTDVAWQKAVEEQEKSTWTPRTGIPFVPDWTQKAPTAQAGWSTWQKAVAVLVGIALLGAGVFVGYNFLKGQPAGSPQPTLIAAPPTATPQPTVASQPTQPQPSLTAEPTQPPIVVTPQPTPEPVITPEPVVTPEPIILPTGLDTILTGPPVSYADAADDQDEELPDDPAVPPQPGTELTGAYAGTALLPPPQGLAAVDSFVAGTVRSAQVEELWPCTDANVICGPAELEPGDYFVIGFSTAAPPPLESPDGIYQVYYLMTDIDGDFSDNAAVTPPFTNYIYLSSEYVIEGGWYGATAALGETDYGGPIGPDGETPRYNVPAASRLVLSQDPPGGFFIVPHDHVGSWFRVSTMWRDFNVQERHIRVDSVGALGGLELMPVPGRAGFETLSCVNVDVVAEPLAEQPAHLDITFQLLAGMTLAAGASADVTVISGPTASPTTIEATGLVLEDLGSGTYSFQVGVPSAARNMFGALTLGGADVTDEFIALGGAGVNVPPQFSGYALGQPDCGS